MAHIEELFDYLKIRGGSLTEAEIRMMLHSEDWDGDSFLSSRDQRLVACGYILLFVVGLWVFSRVALFFEIWGPR